MDGLEEPGGGKINVKGSIGIIDGTPVLSPRM